MKPVFAFLALPLLFTACGGDNDATDPPPPCTPGQVEACLCDGNRPAVRTCQESYAFGPCECTDGGGGFAGSSGSGTGGSAGGLGGSNAGGVAGADASVGGTGGGGGDVDASMGGTGGAVDAAVGGSDTGGSAGGPANAVPMTCAEAVANPSSYGCEFWAADLDQQDYMNDPASAPWGLVVINPQSVAVTVTVEQNDAAVGAPLSTSTVATQQIDPGGVAVLAMPTRELDCGTAPNDYASPGSCLSSRALRATATAPVSIQQANGLQNAYSNDSSLLLPSSALGTHYRALTLTAGHPSSVASFPQIVDRSFLTIVGTQPATTVRVRSPWKLRAGPGVTATPAGVDFIAVIGPFDALNLESDTATTEELQSDPSAGNLSGAQVEASANVAVFSGAETAMTMMPASGPPPPSGDTCCLDHVEEQLVPESRWGTTFAIPRSLVRSTGGQIEPDLLRIVAGSSDAQITTNLPAPYASFPVNAGEVFVLWTTTDVVLESNAPIQVALELVAQGWVDGPPTGDPSFAIVPPVTHHLTSQWIQSLDTWTTNWVSVGMPAGTAFTINGSAPACTPAVVVGGYEFTRCELTFATTHIEADQPFVALYGAYASGASLLSPVGMSFGP